MRIPDFFFGEGLDNDNGSSYNLVVFYPQVIYALVEPDSHRVAYVGRSTYIKTRLEMHHRCQALVEFIQRLQVQDRYPGVRILETLSLETHSRIVARREFEWIDHFRKSGEAWLNTYPLRKYAPSGLPPIADNAVSQPITSRPLVFDRRWMEPKHDDEIAVSQVPKWLASIGERTLSRQRLYQLVNRGTIRVERSITVNDREYKLVNKSDVLNHIRTAKYVSPYNTQK